MNVHVVARGALGFTPRTIDEKQRTVELIASTGAGAPRMDIVGAYLEKLSLIRSSVDLSRIDGMPLQDSHRQDGLDKVLGVVRDAHVEKGQLIVRVQISERADAIWKDIAAGIIRNVSVGYAINNFEDTVDPTTGQRVRAVTSWTPLEISLVPVGADAGAQTRGENTMTEIVTNTDATTTARAPVAPNPPRVTADVVTRGAINQEIRALATTSDLGANWSDELIDRGSTVEQAREAAIERVRQAATRPGPQARVTMMADHTDPAQIVQRMGEALYARTSPGHKLSDAARPYYNMTTLDMARHCLQMRGHQTTGLSPSETITRALGGLHTTSDFPLIFADTVQRSMRVAYESAPAALKTVAEQTTAWDFRAKTQIQLGEAPTLEKVNEHGEYHYGTMSEAGESYALSTYGKIFGLTRKAIINDDLSAFTQLAAKFGQSAADFEAQFLVDLLESNPTMSDTYALFDSAHHGNTDTTAISGSTIEDKLASFRGLVSAARLAMRKQTGLSGRPIGVQPRFLVVPPELETIGELLVAAISPTRQADANPLTAQLTLLTEARFSSATRWFLVSDPSVIDGLEYAYLEGQQGPQIETRAGFEVDGVETKCRLDLGGGFIDYRSWYRFAPA